MKKTILNLLFLAFATIAEAQIRVNDTTIYGVCRPANYNKNGPYVGHDQDLRPPADECPQFPGGEKNIFKFIDKHIKIHKGDRDLKVTVIISFIIEKTGKTSNFKVLYCSDKDGYANRFKSEAINLIETLPLWKPGRAKRKPVRVAFVLPVRFPHTR